MKSEGRRLRRPLRPQADRLEARLVLSGSYSVPAEVRAILNGSIGGAPVRPNTPVLPLESAYATASFVDPSVKIDAGGRTRIGRRDYIAPDVTLNALNGFLKIRSTSTIQDNADLIANPTGLKGSTGIFVGDNVAIGTGATILGPAAIGGSSGTTAATAAAATQVGAGAVIDGAIIQAGSFVGAKARVGPGVILPTGYRVLPGADVVNEAQASNPALGMVVEVTSTDTAPATARATIAANATLASGYSMLYQGNGVAGGAATAGPIPTPVIAAGSTIFFGELNNVLGASPEPGTARVAFEPASVSPTFLIDGTATPLPINLSYRFPDRIVGSVNFGQDAASVRAALGRDVSIRGDEGQPITFTGPIGHIGNRVSIHAPLGQVQNQVTSTVNTVITPATGAGTNTTVVTVTTTPGPGTATAGTTAVTTTGINAAGLAITTVTTTTLAIRILDVGAIAIGSNFTALDDASILGGPAGPTAIGDDVVVGSSAVVATSVIGSGAVIGNNAYILNSQVAPGAIVPDGAILINNVAMGFVQG